MQSKLNTGADWIDVEILSNKTAIVKDISLNYEIGYGDLVLYDYDKKITQVVKKNSNTVYIKYFAKTQSFNRLEEYFLKENIIVRKFLIDGLDACLAGLAIPVEIADDDFQIIIHNTPIECELLTDERVKLQDDEFDEDDLEDEF